MPQNSSYIQFARKYRPTTFSELVGQEVLTKTLSYSIANNRLAQVHLLTGIRGVGKTSSARIIAKTINCTDLNITEISPCGECKNCLGFSAGNHPDILEIDAASRTGVDDVREIIEHAEYRPLLGKYKVFIIDEIHMLSKNAFNALLKIIEEPPAHVMFLFATTEVQKIPLTIISRCQRYDLRRLGVDEIYTLLENIAKLENLSYTEESLKIIAIKSEGSARDAITILDQAASYAYNSGSDNIKITPELISDMLGLAQVATIIKLIQHIIANSPDEAIRTVEEIYNEASNLQHFIEGIADFLAELVKAKALLNYHNPLYNSYAQEILNILPRTTLPHLSILWQIFNNGAREFKTCHNELVAAEMLIIKAIYARTLPMSDETSDNQGDNTTSLETPETQKKTEKIAITDFLKYCHSKNEMDIYYLLFNQVEIVNFNHELLSIAGNSLPVASINKIKDLLYQWRGTKYQLNHQKKEQIISLKDQMMNEAKKQENYRLIKNIFPAANISDILLKT